MRAAVITGPGGPDVLALRELPDPVPGAEQVLVRVRTSALNRADLLQRRGGYAAPLGWPSDIPGIEIAGEVAALGPGATRWQRGDRVFGLVGGGAHAEYCVVHERTLARLPDGLSWREAGAIPEAFITAHDALVTQTNLRPGEHVLIHAVGSGVGLAAVQLCRALGAIPYGTARTADKIERARELGLEDGVVVAGDPSAIAAPVARWTNGRGVDVVLELVGGAYVPASIAALANTGRLMLVGLVGGTSAPIDLGRVLRQRLTIRGTVLRSRPLEERIQVTRAFAAEVVPFLERGIVAPVIDSTFPLTEIRAAHERLESNATFGKVVLDV
ncbi:MAG TPA: NAD(P)H-quinone oxidoreductase [Gemmatimonadaceae bacterium]|nr:NAD(P)H-quinone oxidoreductase [Gemmatimonadaceae bacterium]